MTSHDNGGKKENVTRIASHLEVEEEEMTTSDDEQPIGDKKIGSPPLAKKEEKKSEGEEVMGEEGDQSDEEEESDGEEEEQLPEMLARSRTRRPNAGHKMAELMAVQMSGSDEFYTNAYGGFEEGEHDDDFESPPHSSDEEVDSDFDKPENDEDEPTAPMDEDPERADRKKKMLKQKRLLERNKNWAIARINKAAIPENSCDPKTQRDRLEEAKKTTELNIASLKRFEDLELERKKRHSKATQRKKLEGPRIKEMWTTDGRHLISLPESFSGERIFPKPERKEFRLCAVTGQPALYIDPLTRLPFADAAAFRVLRDKYKQFVSTEKQQRQQNKLHATGGDSATTAEAEGGPAELRPAPPKQRKMGTAAMTEAAPKLNCHSHP